MNDHWDTAMSAWSDQFADLMLPFDRILMSRDDLLFIGNGTPGFSFIVTEPCPSDFSLLFKSNLTRAITHYPMGAYLRLDGCSFRNGMAMPRAVGANGAIWLMRQANPKVSGLIRRSLWHKQAVSLFLFPWLPIPQWAEFRIFVREGKVLGISQYHVDGAFAAIAQHEAAIKPALDLFIAAALPRLRQADVVLDVLAEPVPQAGFRIRLLDIASFGLRTDRCLFAANGVDDFDGGFRFRRADVTVNMPISAIDVAPTLPPSSPPAAQTTRPPSPEDDVWRV